MNNVGDIKTFTLSGAPADGGGLAYLFKWWDGTVTASRLPSVQKKLNVGGTLLFNTTESDQFGQSRVYNGTIVVNFPPRIIGSPTISNNDAGFPYTTLLRSVAYDPEHPGGTELTFSWYNGPSLLGNGTTTVLSTGTYQNQFQAVGVNVDETLTQVIRDTQNGTTKVDYFLRGFTPSGLQGSSSSISNSIVSSANNLSQIIIGPGQNALFTSYAKDTSSGQLQFLWTAGTLNGWSSDLNFTDTPAQLPNGLFKSQITVAIENETPGLKQVICAVSNLSTGQTISFDTSVTLVAARTPTITSISADAPLINGGYAVSQSGFVHFSAQASDPNHALLSYQWTFSQPSVVLFGRTVMLRPADYSVFDEATLVGDSTNPGTGPLPIIGQVMVTDRFNKSATVNLNQFVTTLVWPFTQVSPQTSGTGSTTLQRRYWGLSTLAEITANDLTSFDSDFGSTRNQTHSFLPVNQYIYLIYPASMGEGNIDITTDASLSTNWVLSTLILNSVAYNVYRSVITLNAFLQVTVS